ncbi:MAG: hypothetical protein E7474_14860 [Ruminococcaceae bacterium]|nr:hypothetical protein [Oscillospiraceae bacterium]
MDFVFDLEPVAGEELLPQLAAALQARTELSSRARYPKMWRMTDKLGGGPRVSPKAKRRRRVRYRIYGAVLLALGVFLFLPALTNRDAGLAPMLVGALALFMSLQAFRWSSDKGLLKTPEADFEKPARQLLDGLAAPGRHGGRVTFANAGIELRASSGESAGVDYRDVDYLFETADLIVFTDGARIIVLRKAELAGGDVDGWRALIVKKTENYIDLRAAPKRESGL